MSAVSGIARAFQAIRTWFGWFSAASTQATWWVDPAAGLDTNSGAAVGAPLKTFTELQRRIELQSLPPFGVTVNLLSNCPENFALDALCAFGLTIQGVQTQTAAGSITAVTTYSTNAGGVGRAGSLTDAAVAAAFWTGHLGECVVLTSGANSGAWGWVLKDLGAKTCRFSPFWNGAATIDPQVGDNYKVVSLTQFSGVVRFRGNVNFQDITFGAACFPLWDGTSGIASSGATRCRFATGFAGGAPNAFFGCEFDTNAVQLSAVSAQFCGSQFTACGFRGVTFVASKAARVWFATGMSAWSDVGNTIQPIDGGAIQVDIALGVFDAPVSTGILFATTGGRAGLNGVIFGTGNAAASVLHVTGATVGVAGAAKLPNNLAGTTQYALVGAATAYTAAELAVSGVSDPSDGGSIFVGGVVAGTAGAVSKVFWGAQALVALTATAQNMQPGSGASTAAAGGDVIGILVADNGTVTRFVAGHTGNAANVGGQTMAYKLLLNGVQIGTTVTIAANGGVASGTATFAAVAVVPGDVLRVTATPSAVLTGGVTDLMAAAA